MKSSEEAAFQSDVVQLATLFGWRHYHTHDSRRSVAGFPDLVLVRGDRLLFVELKARTGRVSPDQKAWLAALRGVPGIEVHVWWPHDWPDAIRTRLARSSPRSES